MRDAPTRAIFRQYFPTSFLYEVAEDIIKKIPVWRAGIEEPTPCEKLAYDSLVYSGILVDGRIRRETGI